MPRRVPAPAVTGVVDAEVGGVGEWLPVPVEMEETDAEIGEPAQRVQADRPGGTDHHHPDETMGCPTIAALPPPATGAIGSVSWPRSDREPHMSPARRTRRGGEAVRVTAGSRELVRRENGAFTHTCGGGQ